MSEAKTEMVDLVYTGELSSVFLANGQEMVRGVARPVSRELAEKYLAQNPAMYERATPKTGRKAGGGD